MSKPEIFLSYSHVDKEIALKLAAQLRKSGANIWVDRFDISPGDIWDVEIENALQRCDYLLFVISRAAVCSNNVLNEVYYALDTGKKVVPVKINECKIPFRIMRLHYIDLSENYDQGVENLVKALNRDRPLNILQPPAVNVNDAAPVPDDNPGLTKSTPDLLREDGSVSSSDQGIHDEPPEPTTQQPGFSLKQAFGPYKLAVNTEGTFNQEVVTFDKINIRKAFRIEAKVKSLNPAGSTRFGISWNFISPQDFFLFTLHNIDLNANQSTYSIGRGNAASGSGKPWLRYSIGDLAIDGNTYNSLSIEKQGKILNFYVNSEKVWNTSQYSINTNTFAFWVADFSLVACESLKAFQ